MISIYVKAAIKVATMESPRAFDLDQALGRRIIYTQISN